jgi:hypothetical protein
MVGVVRGAILRLLTANPHPLGRGYSTLESAMNIELEEVVVLDVSDDALEQAAGGAQGGYIFFSDVSVCFCF